MGCNMAVFDGSVKACSEWALVAGSPKDHDTRKAYSRARSLLSTSLLGVTATHIA